MNRMDLMARLEGVGETAARTRRADRGRPARPAGFGACALETPRGVRQIGAGSDSERQATLAPQASSVRSI